MSPIAHIRALDRSRSAAPVLVAILTAVVAVWCPVVVDAGTVEATNGPLCSRIDPDHAGSGQMIWRGPAGWLSLPILRTDVSVEVAGVMVTGTVTQSFRNSAPGTIEAVYVFPLPEHAAVHHMEIRMGNRRITSVVQEREEARATYEKAASEGKKAALLEQSRPNLFRTSVANINPGESIDVVLEYVEELSWTDGEFGLSVPLTLTPRFAPPASSTQPTGTSGGTDSSRAGALVKSAAHQGAPNRMPYALDEAGSSAPGAIFASSASPAAPRASFHARIRAGLPLRSFGSPSHSLRSSWDGDTLVLETKDETIPADRDILIRWRPLLGDEPRSALITEDREDGTYALLMLFPPADANGPAAGLPTETMFVVDVSGSMNGPSILQAREALAAAIGRLRDGDTFDLMAFNHEQTLFREGFVEATDATRAEALSWVWGLRADGGTMICPALRRALSLMSGRSDERVRRIVFLTDGAVENEEELFASITPQLGSVRLHALGIGAAPNRWLMRELAARGRGLCDFISDTATAGDRIAPFLERLDRPVVTDLKLDWIGATPEEVYPKALPDLHAGEPLVVSARLRRGDRPTRAVLTGLVRGGQMSIESDAVAADPAAPFAAAGAAERHEPAHARAMTSSGVPPREDLSARVATSPLVPSASTPRDEPQQSVGVGIGVRWARTHVEALLESLRGGPDPGSVKEDVVRVAKSFNLVTRFTSLVAVEETPTATGDSCTVGVPSALPAGSADGFLPQGGTSEGLLLIVGLVLVFAGFGLLRDPERRRDGEA